MRYPTRLAVFTPTHQLTYSELNALANHIACRLLDHLGKPEQAVGLLMENGVSAIAAIHRHLESWQVVCTARPKIFN